MLAVQTDIYSEVDQEMGHRFAYAIDHTPGSDGNGDVRMRKAADLMRSWDGRLTTDSAAASIVPQTRAALWPMILEPKLGKLSSDYHWGEANICRRGDRDARQTGVAAAGLQGLERAADRCGAQGNGDGKAPPMWRNWSYGNWHVVDIEHPFAAVFAAHCAHRGHRPRSR